MFPANTMAYDSHWMPPSGEYSPRIAPADAMVINVGVKN
jgi:hypothetical protein